MTTWSCGNYARFRIWLTANQASKIHFFENFKALCKFCYLLIKLFEQLICFIWFSFHYLLVLFTIYKILKERRVSTLRSFYPFSWEEQGRQNGIWSKLLIKIDFMVLQLLLTTAQVATFALDTVQDFLIKLRIKTCMHLWEISLFFQNFVILRPTKNMNRADKNSAHF